ncbi:MAG: MarR family transcriptional regulator [Anaerolineales bacterium]|nr:MarR family transcriptional regulator [Anaerolineales bacterium]
MQDVDVNIFLQSLQGKQATLVLAFLCIRRAMTLDELETCTGLNNDTVRSAVKGLASKGLLAMQRGEHGRQTWLPSGDTFFGRLFGQNPKISDSGSSSSSKLQVSSNLPQEQEESAESEKIGFCLAACDEFGIREPKRGKISRLSHVTPEFIKAHVMQVQDEHLPLGTAIHRIEFNWMPEPRYLEPREDLRGYWNKYIERREESEDE